jgi:hypothetical protein
MHTIFDFFKNNLLIKKILLFNNIKNKQIVSIYI